MNHQTGLDRKVFFNSSPPAQEGDELYILRMF